MQHKLQVQSGKKKPREHARGPEYSDCIGCCDIAELEKSERHERGTDFALDRQEYAKKYYGSHQSSQSLKRSPTQSVAVYDPVYGQHE